MSYFEEQKQGARVASIIEVEGKIAGYGSLLMGSGYPLF